MAMCALTQAVVTAIQHVMKVDREVAERIFADGVRRTDEEREARHRRMYVSVNSLHSSYT